MSSQDVNQGDQTVTNRPFVTLDRSIKPIRMNRREILMGIAAGSVVAFTGCAYNEQLGRNQLMLVSDGEMASLASRAWSDIKKKEKISRNPKYSNRLRGIGRKVTTAANMNNVNWEYETFESDEKNAFVLPGGKVGFYTGMMEFVDNDAQLATIIGHEVGHVRARHSAERYSQQLASQVGMTAAQVAVAASDVSYGAPLISALGLGLQFGVLLPYSRAHEREADSLGLTYMTRAGYNPHQSVALWQKMLQEGNGRRPPEFMSTHPIPSSRISALQQQIAQMGY